MKPNSEQINSQQELLNALTAKKESEKLLQINTEKLEEHAYNLQAFAQHTNNLTIRYKLFNKSKRILKIAELIRKERESNE